MFKHIKNLKDVKELNLTDNPEYKKVTDTKDGQTANVSPYICPLIGLEMNGKYRFLYFWSCGCVLSERALKIIKDNNCHKCQKPFTKDDVIILNGTDEEKTDLEKRMLDRQSKLKAEKMKKKLKTSEPAETNTSDNQASTSGISNQNGNIKSQSSGEQNGSKLKLPAKRHNDNGIEDPDFKKTRADYSVAKDPKATEVFKSLFTSHKSAEKTMKAHWITYNPFYN